MQIDLFVYQVGSGEISQLSDYVPILPDAG